MVTLLLSPIFVAPYLLSIRIGCATSDATYDLQMVAPGAIVPLDQVTLGGGDGLGRDQHGSWGLGLMVVGLLLHAHVDAVVGVGEDTPRVDRLRWRVLQRTSWLLLRRLLVSQLCNRQLLLLLQW